jgi:poly(3-hydroxybutyrate) depolymerase
VDATKVNYPAYIAKFWFDNNLRVSTAPEPPGSAPTGLSEVGTTANSVSLSWNAVSGASGYNVYRNTIKVNPSPVAATSYTDTGLAASTTYSYGVTELYSGGESPKSTPVSATTKPAFTCTTTTASNYAHVTAGRATQSGGYAWAKGSNQNMGLYNTFVTTTLAQTAAGYYIIGNCP